MLKLNDLNVSKELNEKEMAGVRGGSAPVLSLFSPISIPSFSEQIAATTALGGAATNTNSMVNAGVNTADSGSQIVAPVFMGSTQTNDNDVYQLAAQLGIQSSI